MDIEHNKSYKIYVSGQKKKKPLSGKVIEIDNKYITLQMDFATQKIPKKALLKAVENPGSLDGNPVGILIDKAIRFSNMNETLRKIIQQELTIKNPKYEEAYRRGQKANWRISKTLHYYRPYKNGDMKIPRGFKDQLITVLKENHVEYDITDKTIEFPPLDIEFHGELRRTQKKAIHFTLKNEYGVLSAPTGAGKTVMGLNMISQRKQPTLILVHTNNLLEQWQNRIEYFLHISKEEIGIYGGGVKKIGEKITIGMVQTLYKDRKGLEKKFGMVIVDECHRQPSDSFSKVVSHFPCKYLLGLSATPWRTDGFTELIFWYLGDLRYEIPRKQLIERNEILTTDIFLIETEYTTNIDPRSKYTKMLAELVKDENRNNLIISKIIEETGVHNGTILILSDRKNHCKLLQKMLKKEGVTAELLIGGEDQTTIINRLEAGKIKVIIATSQLIGEGFDYDEFYSLFLTTPIKSKLRILQYAGRILRTAEGKEKARMFDFVDVNVPTLLNQMKNKKSVYKELRGE